MSSSALLKKLIYQTRYRGMLETELMLQNFIRTKGKDMGIEQLHTLEKVLSMEEPTLLAILTATDTLEGMEPAEAKLIHDIRSSFNKQSLCK